MNWEALTSKNHFHGCNVLPNYINISVSAFKEIGSPESVNIEFDRLAKAVRFSSGGHFKVKVLKGNKINCTLGKIMPCGRYLLKDMVFVKQDY